MHPFLVVAAAAAVQQSPAASEAETIVVTASREPVQEEDAGVSATLFDRQALESLALPLASDLLRLVPGVSVAVSGPRGSLTDVRIRGAEADHTLIFVDGIRFNDPAAGNTPRFDLLTSDLLSRVEVVRGPQSALWGSEALGGVVAVETANPLRSSGVGALAEYGSHDSGRASAEFAARLGDVGVSGSGAWLTSEGIDAFGKGGERDGFENRSASLKAVFSPLPSGEIGIVGHYVDGTSEYDGNDPATFRRANTLDLTRNRLWAVRGWGSVRSGGWALSLDGSYLDSANRNRLDEAPLNSTFGKRFTLGGQLSRTFGSHRLTAAIEHEGENFRARDQLYFGGTDQDRSRSLTGLIGQWRAMWSERFITDLAVRHDDFSAFEDATTVRGTILFRPARQWTVHGSYGEGIAQPTFYDLFGFFPGSFNGNPGLRPESSAGWEAGIRWRSEAASLGITGFSNRLKNEILPVFDPRTFIASTINAEGKSPRRGLELDGGYRWKGLRLDANYTFLDARERRAPGDRAVKEARRPRHSANLTATGSIGGLDVGAALSYVGERGDTDFDVFPARKVTLDDYVLASVKLGWRLTPTLEAYARVENVFDAAYEDVIGYNTAGRAFYAGIRLRPRL
jgi:vitamin B12 transporter